MYENGLTTFIKNIRNPNIPSFFHNIYTATPLPEARTFIAKSLQCPTKIENVTIENIFRLGFFQICIL